MTEHAPDSSQLDQRQERAWFRIWIACLAAFFIIAGGGLAYVEFANKVRERHNDEQLLSPTAPDPGRTAPDESATDKAQRVDVGIYLERIPELSIKETSWTAVFDIWFRWKGAAENPAADFIVLEGEVASKEKLAEHHDGDSHYERHRVVVKITKAFPISRLPLDDQLLTIGIESPSAVRENLCFVPDTLNSSVSSRVSVPGYTVCSLKTLEKPHSYKTTRGDPRLPQGHKSTHSQFRAGISIKRDGIGLFVKMFQALYVAVAIALLACFIKPTDVDPRFGLGVGALFAAVANSYLVGSFVPDTGEQVLADLVNALGILTILVTLIESTISLYLYDRRGEVELSKKLDRVSFRIMAVGYACANLLLVIAAMF